MQRGKRTATKIYVTAVAAMALLCMNLYAQEPSPAKRYRVENGVLKEIEVAVPADSIQVAPEPVTDSLAADSVQELSRRELRRLERARQDADTNFVRHSRIFRDSIPISRMCAISAVAPGFSQLYNRQAWKIPILYATAGSSLYFGLKENKTYSKYKRQYDQLIRSNASREEINPVQTRMIRHNTTRQLLFAGAIASYIYFIGDGALNYDGYTSPVKKATTLSTICPGAGQIYNKSYWKVPVVLGGFATMAYVIDWNNRGYKRFKLAYDLVADGDDTTVDEFNGRYSEDFLKNLKNSYRRNRDLCIIMTGALYLLNIIDAHVDAHLKDYDISDDLAMSFEPSMSQFYSMTTGRSTNMLGFSLKINF